MLPTLIVAGLIPLFIAFPIAIFSLNMLRNINTMVARIDDLLKFDSLTGVLNRSHFYQLTEQKRSNTSFFAIIDADHFKRINDTYGHDCGDRALRLLAQHLSQVFGPFGLVGRLGGEEFGIYLPDISAQQLQLLVVMLRSNLRVSPLRYEGQVIALTVSIGVVLDTSREPVVHTTKQADKCLYAAKAAGRDRCYIRNDVDEMVQLAA